MVDSTKDFTWDLRFYIEHRIWNSKCKEFLDTQRRSGNINYTVCLIFDLILDKIHYKS